MHWAPAAIVGLGLGFCMLRIFGIRWSVHRDGDDYVVSIWTELP